MNAKTRPNKLRWNRIIICALVLSFFLIIICQKTYNFISPKLVSFQNQIQSSMDKFEKSLDYRNNIISMKDGKGRNMYVDPASIKKANIEYTKYFSEP